MLPAPMPGLQLTGKGWGRPANRQRAPGKQSVAGRARRLQNPFPAMGGRAIMIPVYGFFQSFPPRKLAGPSPTRTDCLGSNLALPALVPTRTSARPLRDAEPGLSSAPPASVSMRRTTLFSPLSRRWQTGTGTRPGIPQPLHTHLRSGWPASLSPYTCGWSADGAPAAFSCLRSVG